MIMINLDSTIAEDFLEDGRGEECQEWQQDCQAVWDLKTNFL